MQNASKPSSQHSDTPPRRQRILEWQSQQHVPAHPHPDDRDNLYRNHRFPEQIYDHIGHYQHAKLEAD